MSRKAVAAACATLCLPGARCRPAATASRAQRGPAGGARCRSAAAPVAARPARWGSRRGHKCASLPHCAATGIPTPEERGVMSRIKRGIELQGTREDECYAIIWGSVVTMGEE